MAQINDYYYEDLTPASLGHARRVRRPQAAEGLLAGRHATEPAGGPLTLTDPSLYDGSRAKPIKLPNAPEPA